MHAERVLRPLRELRGGPGRAPTLGKWRARQDSRGADPRRRLQRFFQTLYGCLARGGRAVLQVYPESAAQAALLTDAAMRAGFSGGLVVDFPHSTRAKKYFLVRV